MHQPIIYRECTLPAGTTSLFVPAEADLFTDPGATPSPAVGFEAGYNRLRVKIQVTGGAVWVQCNGIAAADNYGFLMADGTQFDPGVPFNKLSFFKDASSPVVRLMMRGDAG
jgi:hypothetical protein